eukprot:gene4285-334_t
MALHAALVVRVSAAEDAIAELIADGGLAEDEPTADARAEDEESPAKRARHPAEPWWAGDPDARKLFTSQRHGSDGGGVAAAAAAAGAGDGEPDDPDDG